MPNTQSKNTGFFDRVYDLVARIPPGKVMSYGGVAAALDNACSARYVGYAMSAAPEARNLACWRVVNKAGKMAGGTLFGGEENQRRILENEGVIFTENGRVDMARCEWTPF